jgi:hypothetical protein
MARAYAATLIRGPDGCARIDPEAALRWMRAAGGKCSVAGRDASEQRRNLLAAMANWPARAISRSAKGRPATCHRVTRAAPIP